MSKDYYLLPLAIDLAVYGVLGMWLMRAWARRPFLRSARLDAAAAALVWVAGAMSFHEMAKLIFLMADYATPLLWYGAAWTVTEVRPELFAY